MTEDDNTAWRTVGESDGAIPLSEDEKDGLRLSWVTTRRDLNEAEAMNIGKALRAKRWSRLSTEQLLDDHELRNLHAAMFSDVWNWAGKYRMTEKNIGCDPTQIAVRVRDLCRDANLWFTGDAPADEDGCRFHHTLVAIHPFANGNGRHARAATDLLMRSVGADPFTWGRVNLEYATDTRRSYIAALRAADRGDLDALMAFARS